MKFLAPLALAALALVGCSKGSDTPSAPAAPVAAVTAPAGQNWTETVAQTDEGFRMGNPDAPVKLVEYGARLCPACKAFAGEGYQPLIEKYVSTGKVSFEFRDFLIHGPVELALAALGRCGGTASFFPILEQSYADQDAFVQKWQAMPPAQQQALIGKPPHEIALTYAEQLGAIDYVKQRGIPDAKARACLADDKQLEAIGAVTDKAGAAGTVTGTPTLIVNGSKVDGIGWADVEKALKAAGA